MIATQCAGPLFHALWYLRRGGQQRGGEDEKTESFFEEHSQPELGRLINRFVSNVPPGPCAVPRCGKGCEALLLQDLRSIFLNVRYIKCPSKILEIGRYHSFSSKILGKIGRYPLPHFLVKISGNSNPNFCYTESRCRYDAPLATSAFPRCRKRPSARTASASLRPEQRSGFPR